MTAAWQFVDAMLGIDYGWEVGIEAENIYSNLSSQEPTSWMYNFVEVSGHNLESSQTWGFCMDFLNHSKGGYVQCTVTEP